MREMQGKRVCVIGGGSGIGASVARLAADAGAEVLTAGRSGRGAAAVVDVTDDASVAGYFAGAGTLDHVVVSVSTAMPGCLVGGGWAAMRVGFETKYWGALRVVRAAAPLMAAGGSIVLISGVASRRAVAGMENLTPLNAAVEGLVRALAAELAPLRVNGIAPGLIDTPYWDGQREMLAQAGAALPLGRAGRGEDCARAALYLFTSEWVTGTVLDVDGGFLSGGSRG